MSLASEYQPTRTNASPRRATDQLHSLLKRQTFLAVATTLESIDLQH